MTFLLLAGGLMSLVTYVAYAMDKAAARSGRWRTRESTLHLLALLGGWPGALLAQRHLRHKLQKRGFLVCYWFTVLLNCMLLLSLGRWWYF